jgi:hypothetical protein
MPDPGRRADSRIRTDDLIITNDLLYQLSYIGILVLGEWDHILPSPHLKLPKGHGQNMHSHSQWQSTAT